MAILVFHLQLVAMSWLLVPLYVSCDSFLCFTLLAAVLELSFPQFFLPHLQRLPYSLRVCLFFLELLPAHPRHPQDKHQTPYHSLQGSAPVPLQVDSIPSATVFPPEAGGALLPPATGTLHVLFLLPVTLYSFL